MKTFYYKVMHSQLPLKDLSQSQSIKNTALNMRWVVLIKSEIFDSKFCNLLSETRSHYGMSLFIGRSLVLPCWQYTTIT